MRDPTKTSPLLPPTSLARLLAHVVEPGCVLCFELRSAVATPPAVAAGSNRLGQERAVERGAELVQQLIQILARARPAAHLNRNRRKRRYCKTSRAGGWKRARMPYRCSGDCACNDMRRWEAAPRRDRLKPKLARVAL